MGLGRRQMLSGLGVTGIVGLAGCTSPSGGSGSSDAPSMEVAWPTVNSEMKGWEEINRRKSSQTHTQWYVFNVNSYERTIIYQNAALQGEVSDKTLGQFDSTLAIFFATHINLEGNGTIGANKGNIAEIVLGKFEDQMEDNGVQNPRQRDLQDPSPGIEDSKTYEYRGQFTTPRITREASLGEELGTRTLEISKSELPITGLVTIWKEGNGTAFVGGGAFPAQDFEKSDTITATSKEGDGIDVTVSIDLNLQPSTIRRNIIDLIENIERSNQKA